MHWILFYREMDHIYYFSNGLEKPICVMPPKNIDPWPDELAYPPIEEIIATPRKKTFSINRMRYVITARGEFVTH